MKDTEARADIRRLEGITIRLDGEIYNLKSKGHETTIKHCSVCKHDTMQKEERYWGYPNTNRTWWEYYCLTCGTKFKCTTKEVCEPCKEAK